MQATSAMRQIVEEDGFSLLEALIAMAVLGLASMAVGHLVHSSPERTIASAFDTLEAVLADARSRAVRDGRTILIEWSSSNHMIQTGTGRTFRLPISAALNAEGALELSSKATTGIAVFPDGTTSGAVFTVTVDGTASRASVSWIDGGLKRE